MSRTSLPLALFGILFAVLAIGLSRGGGPDWTSIKHKIHAELPTVRHLSVDELAAWLAAEAREPPILLDVREEAEYRVSHLRGAVRVDPDAAEPALPEHVDPDTPIVAYCSVGYRSAVLVRRLMELGYTDVSSLEGSIFEWANRGHPVYRGDQPVREVHPYNEYWSQLLDEDLRVDRVDQE